MDQCGAEREIAVAGLRFLDEASQELVGNEMRRALQAAYEECPSLAALTPHRLVLVPTSNALEPDVEARSYIIELEVVPTAALTDFDSYRVAIGGLDLAASFEEEHQKRKRVLPLLTGK